MTEDYIFPPEIREVIKNALPVEPTQFGSEVPQLQYTYLPAAHAKALRPDSMLVSGIRGSGKSFWWAALQKKEHREILGKQTELSENTIVSPGFGQMPPSIDTYPGKDSMAQLLDKYDARIIWKTVVVKHVCSNLLPQDIAEFNNWPHWTAWVQTHPDEVDQVLIKADNELEAHGIYHLILFDALDRTADDWKTMNRLVRGLLQAMLDFRNYKRIRLKAFVRPDQIEDPSVTAFPDASKIISQKTELYWPRHELYGLLWQHLGNGPKGSELFREGCQKISYMEWVQENGIWRVPKPLSSHEETQRKVFHAMTGPWMGRGPKRGFPYTWLPNHLGDTRKQVSPRSFLAALRHAAQDSRTGYKYALHYEGIKKGVQEASKIRVEELKEDYPWLPGLLKPLKGISVPCPFDKISKEWEEQGTLRELDAAIMFEGVRLPPPSIAKGSEGVLEDMIHLGLMEQLSGDRINLPDVYRVGYGIGRRGGVKAVAK